MVYSLLFKGNPKLFADIYCLITDCR